VFVIVIGVVVPAASLHACWNAIVKSIDDRLSVMAVLGLTATLVCLPIALLARSGWGPGRSPGWWCSASG
jgi:hypothetical protein